MNMLPTSGRPRVTKEQIDSYWFEDQIAKYPVRVTGLRGYYRETMGDPTKNDRAIYDDCIAITCPKWFMAFNANTDPSVTKDGVALLKATQREGEPYLYRIGMHNMRAPYKALRQYGRVTVLREGRGSQEFTDTSNEPFYIDIHKGGFGTTSSLGCQTIHPTQWGQFINSVEFYLNEYKQVTIPYKLIEL